MASKKAYLFWYVLGEGSKTEYVYIIARSLKEARDWYIAKGYTHMYDYSTDPVDIIDEAQFNKWHDVGDLLGENAII